MKTFFILCLCFIYQFIGAQTLVPYHLKKGNYIFVDSATMKPVLTKEYSDAYFFYEGLAAIKLNDKWGFIDKKGNEVIALTYAGGANQIFEPIDPGLKHINVEFDLVKYEKPFFMPAGSANVYLSGKTILIDKTGKEIESTGKAHFNTKKYSYVGDLAEGFAKAVIKTNGSEKYGFVDFKGNEVIPLEYDAALSFNNGLALVQKNKKWIFINKIGKNNFSEEYDEAYDFSDGMALVNIDNVCWYIDKTGKKIVKAGPAIILSPKIIQGKPRLLKLSNPYNPFINGYALVTRNSTWKIIDKANNEYPLEVEFDDLILPCSIYGVIKFKKDGKVGLLNNQGKVIAPAKYDRIETFINGAAIYRAGNISGLIDYKGKEIIAIDLLLDVTNKWENFSKNGFAQILIMRVGSFYIDKAGREYREQ